MPSNAEHLILLCASSLVFQLPSFGCLRRFAHCWQAMVLRPVQATVVVAPVVVVAPQPAAVPRPDLQGVRDEAWIADLPGVGVDEWLATLVVRALVQEKYRKRFWVAGEVCQQLKAGRIRRLHALLPETKLLQQ